jgi:hypothetical protein
VDFRLFLEWEFSAKKGNYIESVEVKVVVRRVCSVREQEPARGGRRD